MEEYNIRELLEQLNENKKRLDNIVQDMAQKRRDYETSLIPLKEEYSTISDESSKIGSTKFSIKLGDLLDEMCWLSETNVEDLEISLYANVSLDGVHNIEDFLGYISDVNNCHINFRLSSDNKGDYSFNYATLLSMNLNSIQADGRTLLEHCSAVVERRRNGGEYTELVVDKDIENVILSFNLNYLSMETSATWRPADLFTQAVLNCEEREQNARVDKIRQRIKDGE